MSFNEANFRHTHLVVATELFLKPRRSRLFGTNDKKIRKHLSGLDPLMHLFLHSYESAISRNFAC